MMNSSWNDADLLSKFLTPGNPTKFCLHERLDEYPVYQCYCGQSIEVGFRFEQNFVISSSHTLFCIHRYLFRIKSTEKSSKSYLSVSNLESWPEKKITNHSRRQRRRWWFIISHDLSMKYLHNNNDGRDVNAHPKYWWWNYIFRLNGWKSCEWECRTLLVSQNKMKWEKWMNI